MLFEQSGDGDIAAFGLDSSHFVTQKGHKFC